MLQEYRDYNFVPHPEDDEQYAVKILRGDYMGVVFSYGKISAKESNDRISGILSYTYDVLVDPGDIITNQEHFGNHVGDILSSIITNINRSENPTDQLEYRDESVRDDNSSEPDSE